MTRFLAGPELERPRGSQENEQISKSAGDPLLSSFGKVEGARDLRECLIVKRLLDRKQSVGAAWDGTCWAQRNDADLFSMVSKLIKALTAQLHYEGP